MSSILTKKIVMPKNIAFGVRKIWAIFCIGFIILVFFVEAVMGWYFIITVNMLDAPVIASIHNNSNKINEMEKSLERIENIINERASIQEPPSQSSIGVIE